MRTRRRTRSASTSTDAVSGAVTKTSETWTSSPEKLPLDRRAGVLSSGMRQRLRWVWAEIAAPRLLLYDEPFQNLDGEGVAALSAIFERRLAAGAAAVVAAPERRDLDGIPGGVRELRLAG